MTGSLVVVGAGPAGADLMTPAAARALADATDLVGYETYLRRIALQPHQSAHATGNRVEIDRARHALQLAASGRRVAVVSGGDPGVFAMASAVFEAIENGADDWRDLDIRVEPGITAMLAAAAKLGAPLGADFCAISLSDNLKSWDTIVRRLTAAAQGDFVTALYNPASKARPTQLTAAFRILRDAKGEPHGQDCIVAMVRGAGTDRCETYRATLATVDATWADMRTLVIVGAAATRTLDRANGSTWIYSPRSEWTGVRR